MKKSLVSFLTLVFVAPALSVHAAGTAVDCSKKKLASEIAKLDKTAPNVLNISGNCTEDIVVSGFKDLTLIGVGGARITAVAQPTGTGTALVVSDESRVTVETLTISGGFAQNITCVGRSRCVLRNVTVEGGGGGIGVQDQSAADILGASVIRNSTGAGVGVYGASAVNIRPEPWITGQEVGPVISGHAGQGAWVQDGSFLRSDNTTFSGNGIGIVAQRNAVLKIYSSASQSSIGGVINNTGDGIIAKWSATASVSVPISGNGGAGVKVGPLTFFQEFADVTLISGNGQGNVVCQHPTAISVPFSYCGH